MPDLAMVTVKMDLKVSLCKSLSCHVTHTHEDETVLLFL